MVARTELESALHRLANNVECQLADVLRELLAESRIAAVHDICYTATRFIESCRDIRDGKEVSEV